MCLNHCVYSLFNDFSGCLFAVNYYDPHSSPPPKYKPCLLYTSGMTQKYLGTIVGFPERSADVRLAQYETGTRKPKAELTAALACLLYTSRCV